MTVRAKTAFITDRAREVQDKAYRVRVRASGYTYYGKAKNLRLRLSRMAESVHSVSACKHQSCPSLRTGALTVWDKDVQREIHWNEAQKYLSYS